MNSYKAAQLPQTSRSKLHQILDHVIDLVQVIILAYSRKIEDILNGLLIYSSTKTKHFMSNPCEKPQSVSTKNVQPQIFAIHIHTSTPTQNNSSRSITAYNVDNISLLYRKTVKEFINFAVSTVVRNTLTRTENQYHEQSCTNYTHNDYIICVNHSHNLIICMVTNETYPTRVTRHLSKVIEKELCTDISTIDDDTVVSLLKKYIDQYKDPSSKDKVALIQKEIGETLEMVQQNLDTLIDRGETIDSLVEKSDMLSGSSKIFYKKAKRLNRCPYCSIL